MIIDYKKLGQLLLELRLKKKLSQKELAKKSGYTYVYIHMIERGKVRLREECLESLSKGLGVNATELLILSMNHPLLDKIKEKLDDKNLYRMSDRAESKTKRDCVS